MNKADEESEKLHEQILEREMDIGAFVQKYKKLRTTYHKRALIHIAARTNMVTWTACNPVALDFQYVAVFLLFLSVERE